LHETALFAAKTTAHGRATLKGSAACFRDPGESVFGVGMDRYRLSQLLFFDPDSDTDTGKST
jgi:hypothetical protein